MKIDLVACQQVLPPSSIGHLPSGWALMEVNDEENCRATPRASTGRSKQK
jgi:hypothetical protein